MNPIPISKELFLETLKALESQYQHDKICHDAFSVILPHDFVSGYDNNAVCNQLVKLLENALDDNQNKWISYFVYELEFGKAHRLGSVIDSKGEPIDLSTPENLWTMLINNNNTY